MDRKNQKGSVSIEATISLTAFLFMFIMVYSLITICRAQAKIGNAINNTAREISQYSYIYGLTGLNESFKALHESASGTKGGINGFIDDVNGTFDAIQNLGDDVDAATKTDSTDIEEVSGNWDSVIESAKTVKDTGAANVKEVKSAIDSLVEDPKGVMLGLARVFASETIDVATSKLIAEPVSKALVKKHLKRFEGDNANSYLASMGVVTDEAGGNAYIDALDFSRSTIFADGEDDIVLVVTYKIEALPLLPIDYDFVITQTAATKGWLNGDKLEPKPAK